jgi:hypothetical protein
MTPADRLRAALDRLHWSGAAILNEDERRVRRWAAGVYDPPENVLVWLERLAAFHEANPAPVSCQGSVVRGQRQRSGHDLIPDD